MRPFQTLIAFALTTTAWLSLSPVSPAQAQPQAGPPVEVAAPPDSLDSAAPPSPSVSVSPPSAVLPVPLPPAVPAPGALPAPIAVPYAPPYLQPALASPLPQSAVLLMPQDQLLASQGSWERRGNELILRHRGSAPGSGRRSGMIAAGITLLSIAYTPALITGALFTLMEGPNDVASSLLLPVGGPFLSGLFALSGQNDLGLSGRGAQTWAYTWMLVDGAVQVTGLALIIAGARARPSSPQSFLERVLILPYSTQNGAGVTISGRF